MQRAEAEHAANGHDEAEEEDAGEHQLREEVEGEDRVGVHEEEEGGVAGRQLRAAAEALGTRRDRVQDSRDGSAAGGVQGSPGPQYQYPPAPLTRGGC